MALYILIGLLLASIVIAFFSAKSWHWGHVLVVIGLALSTAGFFLLAAEVLRINSVYRTKINQQTKDLEGLTARNDALRKGTEDSNLVNAVRSDPTEPVAKIPEDAESITGFADLDHQILIETRRRGRAWRKVTPAGAADAKTGALNVTIPAPTPAGIKPDTVVYLFDDGPPQLPAADGRPRGPQYLGEFRVGTAAGQQASLVPVLEMDDFERQRLAASKGPWIMYESMPADRYAIYAGKTDDELKKLIPPGSLQEYLRHGKEAAAADPPERVIGVDENGQPVAAGATPAKKLYQRRLHDYSIEFDELSRRRVSLLADIDAVKEDIVRLEAAEVTAKKLQAFREDEKRKLTTDLAGIKKEHEVIDAHLAKVEQQLANAKKLLADTLSRNSQLVRTQ